MTDEGPFTHPYAACAGLPLELFFPERGQDTRPAKKVCATCPAREPCGDYAIRLGIGEGVWGGMSTKERETHAGQRFRTASPISEWTIQSERTPDVKGIAKIAGPMTVVTTNSEEEWRFK